MVVDEPKTVSAQDARQGKELGVMRYVLFISLVSCKEELEAFICEYGELK